MNDKVHILEWQFGEALLNVAKYTIVLNQHTRGVRIWKNLFHEIREQETKAPVNNITVGLLT